MLPIRLLTIDDATLFVEIRRLSLSTDPDSFSARHVYAQSGFRETAFDEKTGGHDMIFELMPEAG